VDQIERPTPATYTAASISGHSVDDFAEFFVKKVADIRSATSNAPPAMIAFRQTPPFSHFDPVSEKEVYNQLSKMPSKSCQL